MKALDTEINAQVGAMLAQHVAIEEVLQFLRSEGFSKVASIQALLTVLNLPLSSAKEIVHTSETWSDHRSNVRVHDSGKGMVPRSARRASRCFGMRSACVIFVVFVVNLNSYVAMMTNCTLNSKLLLVNCCARQPDIAPNQMMTA